MLSYPLNRGTNSWILVLFALTCPLHLKLGSSEWCCTSCTQSTEYNNNVWVRFNSAATRKEVFLMPTSHAYHQLVMGYCVDITPSAAPVKRLQTIKVRNPDSWLYLPAVAQTSEHSVLPVSSPAPPSVSAAPPTSCWCHSPRWPDAARTVSARPRSKGGFVLKSV